MKRYTQNKCNVFVKVNGESKEDLFRAVSEFNSRVKRSEVLNDLRRHEFYRKPSVKTKWKKSESSKRRRRDEARSRKFNKNF